ncbi:MAG TPA: SRPBCC family protein [Planktothrix sp.]|jgi:choline monooxygenase
MAPKGKSAEKIIGSDIRSAETLPTEYYRDPKYFELAKDRIFARSWQLAVDGDRLDAAGKCLPWTMLEGYLDEPLVWTRDDQNKVHCFSNVCTHRGNIIVENECQSNGSMRCRYHGRRFDLTGRYLSAPGFEDALEFPTDRDDLPHAEFDSWGKFLFASLNPAFSFDDLIGDMRDRLSWMPLHKLVFDPLRSREYETQANWALYVENYLEGLHVPFVHPGLAAVIDTKDYRYEQQRFSNLQIGLATKGDDAFDLPPDSPDANLGVAAYYYWLFPNVMFNFYPWGASINLIIPVSPSVTRVRFLTYVSDPSRLGSASPELIDKTEREDQDIVQQVQKGIRSRLYKRGRYSPQWEPNVHHFHTLLADFLSD